MFHIFINQFVYCTKYPSSPLCTTIFIFFLKSDFSLQNLRIINEKSHKYKILRFLKIFRKIIVCNYNFFIIIILLYKKNPLQQLFILEQITTIYNVATHVTVLLFFCISSFTTSTNKVPNFIIFTFSTTDRMYLFQ